LLVIAEGGKNTAQSAGEATNLHPAQQDALVRTFRSGVVVALSSPTYVVGSE